MTQLLLWGDYSEYQNVRRHEGIVYGGNFSGNRVQISCVDIVEGTVDAKLALMPEQSRQRALEAVEERRASELSCEEVLEEGAEQYDKRRGFYREGLVLPSSLSQWPQRCDLHRNTAHHDPRSVRHGGRIRMGNTANGLGHGY